MTAGDNPFAPGRLERLLGFDPALAGTSWEALEERWRALGCRAAVTGRHGSGKTTLLRAWAERLGEAPLRLFFNAERRRLTDADRRLLDSCAGRVLFVDGEGHLPWRERFFLRRASRAARGVVVARHRRGPWPELIRLESTPDLALKLFERIGPSADGPLIRKMFRAKNGNLRELWLACYDLAAGGRYFGLK